MQAARQEEYYGAQETPSPPGEHASSQPAAHTEEEKDGRDEWAPFNCGPQNADVSCLL